MFLKSFDLHGFKSFKERTKLEFKDGITTIVGPNGSGKSNIADAFRWVLGEQRIKALRGNKGEDVIFGGTKVHKPLGVATVHMSIDNGGGSLGLPYEEITIGRKIYRSGESDYQINGTSCRLKDIHELFNDTGLGKDSFSIIGQGEIDRVLNAKPEDRRGMIEELAGIVKYRNRKEESIHKIETAEISLRRVLDIITELDAGFGSLEEDARKASRHLELKEAADRLELNLILNDIHEAEGELTNLKETLQQRKDLNAQASAGVEAKEAVYEQNRLVLLNMEEDLKDNRNRLMSLKDVLSELRLEIATRENNMATIQERNLALSKEMEEIADRESNLAAIYEEKLQQMKRWTGLKKEKQQFIRELEGKLASLTQEKNDLLSVGEDIRYGLIDLFQDIAVLHNEVKSVGEEEENLRNREIHNRNEKEALGLYRQELLTMLAGQKEQQHKQQEVAEKAEEELLQMEESKKQLLLSKDQLSIKREEQSGRYQEAWSRFKALQDIQKDYQGYYSGVKSILQERDKGNLKGIRGVVGELIQAEKTVEKAVEIALGGALQDIVVDTTRDAKSAIGYLKSESKGRATFLPLDAVRPRQFNKEQQGLLKEKGVIGIASQLVKVNPAYLVAIENLLGNVLIVSDLDCGAALAKKSGQSLKIVTLDGEQFMPGGALTGGNAGKANSVLSRTRVLEELEKEAKGLRKELNGIQEEMDRVSKNLYPLEGRIEARRVLAKEARLETSELSQGLSLREMEIRNIEEKIQSMDDGRDSLDDELRGLEKERQLLLAKLAEKEADKTSKEQVKTGKEDEVRMKDKALEDMGDELLAEKLALNSLMEKENAFKESLDAYFNEQSDIKAMLDKKTQGIQEGESLLLEHSTKLKLAKETMTAEEDEYQRIDLLVTGSDSGRDELVTVNLALEKEIKEESRLVRDQEEGITTLLVREAKLDADRNNKVALLQEKFGLLPFEAMEKRRDIEDRKGDQRELRSLQNNIGSLGMVNLGAIEEFKRVGERLTFLKEQEGDLRKSIDSLQEVIDEIDKIMIERFTKSFTELNIAFGETYSALFNGGEAFLELTDKEDILGAGIDIYSKPPGKTPKSLSTLSGGERALTALALLFSFLKIKPSPLCIIDEADASLDERNVVSFAKYLKNYSKKTQFIVISHRQGTIEESDNLYGVTMDKSGVSKIISVSLDGKRRMEHA